jgi:hypothetical protein
MDLKDQKGEHDSEHAVAQGFEAAGTNNVRPPAIAIRCAFGLDVRCFGFFLDRHDRFSQGSRPARIAKRAST